MDKHSIIICILLAIALVLAVIKIVLLRHGFDELTDNIEDQVSGKTQIPVTLTTSDPHARKAAETINRELKNLDRERNEYLDGNRKVAEAVTGISHDIRTPLTAINSYLDLMADEEDEELKAQYLERIKSRTLSLSDLADELFKYIESEMLACESELADPVVGWSENYGHVNKACMWAALSRLYLNAETYVGENRYTDCITYSKKVIGAGYQLEEMGRHDGSALLGFLGVPGRDQRQRCLAGRSCQVIALQHLHP